MKKKILFIYAPSGPPIDFALPIMAERADIYTLILIKPGDYSREIIERYSTEVCEMADFDAADAADIFVAAAKQYQVDGVTTFSEFILETVCIAAIRLNLKNVGSNIRLARDKIEMRTAWREAGVPQPLFSEICNENDVHQACKTIGTPLLLKVANGAGSIGQQIIEAPGDISEKLAALITTIEQARNSNDHEISDKKGRPRIIAEAIIPGSTESWYEGAQFGDYLSVEGLVRDGVYYPLAITARLPTLYPFIEVSNLAPCPLSESKKRTIVDTATAAINALNLQNCATHTEIKLLADGSVMLIETAARMGGVAIVKELHAAFGINYVDMLMCILLDEPCDIPAFEATSPVMAAASMSLIAADSRGVPWESKRYFDPAQVDWRSLAGDDIGVTVERSQSMEYGSPMPPFYSSGGVLTNAGIAFVTAPDVRRLAQAIKSILDGLEQHLPPAGR